MKSCSTGYDKLCNKMIEIIDILYGRDRTVVGCTPLVSCKFECRSWRGILDATLCDKSMAVTCDMSVVFSVYSGFLHQ